MGEVPGLAIGIALVLLVIGAVVVLLLRQLSRGAAEVARAAGDAATQVIHAPADAAAKLAGGVAGAFRELFQAAPRIRIDSDVVSEAPRHLLKLVVLARAQRWRTVWTHARWRSEKRIELAGVYTAEVGFDLSRMRVDVRREALVLRLVLPPAEVVLQTESEEIERSKSGLWNRVRDSDRTEALATLRREARAEVERSGVIAAARERVIGMVREQALAHGARFELVEEAAELAPDERTSVDNLASAKPARSSARVAVPVVRPFLGSP